MKEFLKSIFVVLAIFALAILSSYLIFGSVSFLTAVLLFIYAMICRVSWLFFILVTVINFSVIFSIQTGSLCDFQANISTTQSTLKMNRDLIGLFISKTSKVPQANSTLCDSSDKVCRTLEKVLVDYFSQLKIDVNPYIGSEALSFRDGPYINTVCIVANDQEFYSIKQPNCLMFKKKAKLIYNQGYVYSLESGSLRLNYKLMHKYRSEKSQYRLSEIFDHFNEWPWIENYGTKEEARPMSW
ncbi:hypothetical protein MJH12_13020 [bacterium]|nr:hypothetical protein [bacterium]